MLDHVAPDVSSAKNSGSSWKIVTKGKRSKKSVAKNVNGITKLVGRSPKQVGDFMVSNYDKFNKSITGKLVSNEAEHIPPKKRHPLQSSSQPQSSAQYKDESLFPQPLTPSPHGDSKLQLKGFRGSSTLNFRDCVDGVNDSAAFSDVVDLKLYNPDDFSGIELLAAAACIDGMDDDAGNINVIEHSMPTMPASSEPIKCSVSMEQPSSLSSDMVNENTDTKCSSLDNYGVLPQILQENEDVAMKELEASKVDRQYWDLNVMMDDWQEPLDYSVEEAPSVNVSGPNMEVEKLEEEGCKISMKSGNDNSTAKPRHVNQTEQIKSELVCGSDKVSRGLAIFEESPTKPIDDQTPDSDKENKVGYIVSSNSGSPAVEMHQLSRTYVDEVPAHLGSEDISIVCETAKDINQIMSSNNVNTCMDNIGPAGLERSQCGSNIDSVVVALPGETSKLPDNSGSNSSPGQPNRNDLSASSSSSRSVTCTVKGQLDSIYVSDITVRGSPASVLKEPTSFVDENCLPKAGEEVRAALPVAIQKDVDSLNDIPTSGSAEIGPSLGDCHYSDVSQDDRRNTVGSEDMNGFQDGNDSSYEDGELRILMPCPWEENEMDDGNSECVDYESDDRVLRKVDYPAWGSLASS
ncbi:hypothetical protein Leryth_015736 [Lithospermum erythrorhizon]|nr:hypothetical protein Leryth_015736 [Lithospermum erythrorhizon]